MVDGPPLLSGLSLPPCWLERVQRRGRLSQARVLSQPSKLEIAGCLRTFQNYDSRSSKPLEGEQHYSTLSLSYCPPLCVMTTTITLSPSNPYMSSRQRASSVVAGKTVMALDVFILAAHLLNRAVSRS